MPRATSRTAAASASSKPTATPAKKAAVEKKAATAKTPSKAVPEKNDAPAKATAHRAAPHKAAPAKKAAPKKVGPLDKFTQGQRDALVQERASYTKQAESLKAEADLLALEREPGDVQFDEESGEGDTLAVERERDLALSAQASAAVDEIDAALAKIELGTYGVCEQCGSTIPRERLRAIPFAALCVQCKSMGLGRR